MLLQERTQFRQAVGTRLLRMVTSKVSVQNETSERVGLGVRILSNSATDDGYLGLCPFTMYMNKQELPISSH